MRQLPRFVLTLVVITMVAFTNCAFASGNSDTIYTSYGVGTESCGTWLTQRKNGDWYEMGQWMLGYISAVGYYGVFKLKDKDSEGFAHWMDNYCKKHPLASLAQGVQQLTLVLRKSH